uniref:Receptor protein serine/threonine kinase n=1 Tax=Magallana gigas TaxID=29159 RepID=A0A8W8N753_MAGGI
MGSKLIRNANMNMLSRPHFRCCMGSHKTECVVTSCQDNVKTSKPHKFCCCSTDKCNVVQNHGVIVKYKTYNTAKLPTSVSRKSDEYVQQVPPYKSIESRWPFYSENDQESEQDKKGPPVSCAFYDDPSNFKTSRVSPKLVGDRDSTTQEAGKQIKSFPSHFQPYFTHRFYIRTGCFRFKPEDGLCSREVCQSSSPYKILGPTRGPNSAAASGDLCNNNISDVNTSVSLAEDTVTPASSYLSVDSYRLYKEKTIIISLVSIFSVSLVILGSFLLYRLCLSSRKHPPSPHDAVEAPPLAGFRSEDLKIMSLICKTKNGEVWRGQLGEIPVAVKVFLQNHKHLYQNEKYIYSLPFIEHENLLKFYGIDERQNAEGFWQYMIVCPTFEGKSLRLLAAQYD